MPSITDSARDWADEEAEETLRLISNFHVSTPQALEYLAAVFRKVASRAAMQHGEHLIAIAMGSRDLSSACKSPHSQGAG